MQSRVAHADLDIGDASAVDRYVSAVRPDVIVNAAAYTAVDRAESEPKRRGGRTQTGPANLARAAAAVSCAPRSPVDRFRFRRHGFEALPAGRSDQSAERLRRHQARRRDRGSRSICRHGRRPAHRVGIRRAAAGTSCARCCDSCASAAPCASSPTSSAHPPRRIRSPKRSGRSSRDPPSPESITGRTPASRAGTILPSRLRKRPRQRAGSATAHVIPIGTADYPTPAQRPRFSVLDKTATCAALGLTPRHWRQNLRQVIGEISIA